MEQPEHDPGSGPHTGSHARGRAAPGKGATIALNISLADACRRFIERPPERDSGIDRGISPEIGVTLLIAVVTVLGSVVGGMAFKLTDQPDVPAQAVWDVELHSCPDSDDGTLRLRHEGGQAAAIDSLEVHYRWNNNSTTQRQRVDLSGNGQLQAGDVAHERRIDEPRLLETVTLIWKGASDSYQLREFTPNPPVANDGPCIGSEVEPGFVVQGDEEGNLSGECDGSEPAQDRGHGNECDGEDDNNPAGGDDPMTGAN